MHMKMALEALYASCEAGNDHETCDILLEEIFYKEENPLVTIINLGHEIQGTRPKGYATQQIEDRQLERIDCFFQGVDVTRLSVQALVAACMNATMFKSRLKHYKEFHAKAVEICKDHIDISDLA